MTATQYFQKAKEDGYSWADKAIEYRKIAISGREDSDQSNISNLSQAIIGGFNWSKTKEGHDYWEEIYNQVETKRLDSIFE